MNCLVLLWWVFSLFFFLTINVTESVPDLQCNDSISWNLEKELHLY